MVVMAMGRSTVLRQHKVARHPKYHTHSCRVRLTSVDAT
jgi:hypothetical protein